MTELHYHNLGVQGAKVQSWSKFNARQLLARIRTENPEADSEERFHLFKAECAPYFDEILRYWYTNNDRALDAPRRARPVIEAIAEKEERKAKLEKGLATIKARAVEMVLLDITLSTGKRLGDSTGKECAKEGGWLTRISKMVKPDQKVGDALTEAQVRAVFK